MAGQGLGPLMNKKPDILIAPPSRALARLPRRDSPTYDPYRSCEQQMPMLCEPWPLYTNSHHNVLKSILSGLCHREFGAVK